MLAPPSGIAKDRRSAGTSRIPIVLRLPTLRSESAEAAAVSLADKLHNAYAMASSLEAGVDIFRAAPGRTALSAGAEDQLWYFRAVVEATAHHEDPRLDALRARLALEIERFAAAVGLA